MIEWIVAAAAVAAIGALGAALRHGRRRASQPELAPALPPAHRQIQAGQLLPEDVVVHLGTDYLVAGVATIREGDEPILVFARMSGGPEGDDLFLVVEPRSDSPCAVADERPGVGASAVAPRRVRDGDLDLRLSHRAAARLETEGMPDLPEQGPCEMGVYEGPGDRFGLLVVAQDQEILLVGHKVAPEGLQLLPGSEG